MIQVEHLSKVYIDKSGIIKAIDDVSFVLPSSGLVFILGKSGCGKTTLLNMLGGMDSPSEGDIKINGKSINTNNERELDNYRNNYVGFVFQEFNLLTNYTVGSNISLALQLQKRKPAREVVDNILRRVELLDADGNTLYDRKISELSGGQKQRVAIARALIKEPEIILADEPTGNLDSETSASLFKLLKELSKDKLIVVVSHDRENAEKYGDRVIELKDGRIISDSKSNEKCSLDIEQSKRNKKGKLPLNRVVTMGFAGFKKKTIRLAISIVLAVFSLSLFVFTVSAINADLITSELQTVYDNGGKSVILTSDVENIKAKVVYSDGYSDEDVEYFGNAHLYTFTQKQLNTLNEKANIYPILYGLYYDDLGLGVGEEYLSRKTYEGINLYLDFSNELITRYVIVDQNTEATNLGLSPATDNSRLPLTSNEIAITDYQADIFVQFGYQNGEDSESEEINSIQDMIGKTIYNRTIVGIYSTEESLERLKQYDTDYSVIVNQSGEIYSYSDDYFDKRQRGDHMIKSAFISSDGIDMTYINEVVYMLTGSASNDREIIESICYEDEGVEEFSDYTLTYSASRNIKVTSSYTGFVDEAAFFASENFTQYALVGAIVIAIFSALLLTNFLLVSADERKHEIGILRALGASKLDTIKICLAEGMMVGVIDFVLSLIPAAIACLVLNQMYNIYIYSIGLLSVLYLFLLCFGTIALATILPTLKISSQKPIDIIRE